MVGHSSSPPSISIFEKLFKLLIINVTGVWSPRELSRYGKELPNVRFAGSVLVTDEDFPAHGITHMLMQWGQFVDHDLSHVPVHRTGNFLHHLLPIQSS